MKPTDKKNKNVSVLTLVEETVQAEGADDAVVHQQPEPPDPGDEEPIPDPQDELEEAKEMLKEDILILKIFEKKIWKSARNRNL